jgi:hypothetical protein
MIRQNIMYKCAKCGEIDKTKFHPSRTTRCKACLATAQREYRRKRPKDYWKNKDRKYTLKKRYGVCIDEYEKKIIELGNRCEICNDDPSLDETKSKNHKMLHVDHDHSTGKVRGLICNGCNRALGFINDNIDKARNLVKYLEKHL